MKPFFYKINAADFLEKILSINESERGEFALQFALDLVCANSTDKFTKKIISEAVDFKEKKKVAGKSGGLSRSNKLKEAKKQQLKPCSKTQAQPKQSPSTTLANSSSSSSSSNNKTLTSKSKDSGAFAPPLPEQVAEYCESRGKGVDPERWYNFYSAKGWMIGKNKMKDWKAAVRTWESNGKEKPSYGSQGIAVLDELRRRSNGGMDSERGNSGSYEIIRPETEKLPAGRYDPEDS